MLKQYFWKNPFIFSIALFAGSMTVFNTGCVSGGFKLTRSYARWINSNGVVVRVLLYLLLGIGFLFTYLIDLLINNTIDFWSGEVSAGIYNFHKDGRNYQANHEYLPGTKLRRSTLRVTDSNNKLIQEIILKETPKGEVELYVDGKLRTRVENISKVPIALFFDKNGKKTDQKIVPLDTAVAMN